MSPAGSVAESVRETLLALVAECTAIDRLAIELYERFALASPAAAEQKFWRRLAGEERQHVQYWERLHAAVQAGDIENIFPDPEATLAELRQVHALARELAAQSAAPADSPARFHTALRLEFYVAHPGLTALFHLLRRHTRDRGPEDSYERHIEHFLEGWRACHDAAPSPAEQLAFDMLLQLWRNSHLLAEQLDELRRLRTMIPVCASCHQVRDDRGYWHNIERYLHDHHGALFTHALCPDCLRKLYPEHADDILKELEKS